MEYVIHGWRECLSLPPTPPNRPKAVPREVFAPRPKPRQEETASQRTRRLASACCHPWTAMSVATYLAETVTPPNRVSPKPYQACWGRWPYRCFRHHPGDEVLWISGSEWPNVSQQESGWELVWIAFVQARCPTNALITRGAMLASVLLNCRNRALKIAKVEM